MLFGRASKDCAFRCSARRLRQHARMVAQVVFDEALDEPVAVVVAGLHAERQRLAGIAACLFEQLGAQLLARRCGFSGCVKDEATT